MNKIKQEKARLLGTSLLVIAVSLTACSNQTPAVSPTPTSPVISTNLTNPTINPASGWKKYTETREVKFSIEYPGTWTVNTADGMYGEKGTQFESGKERIGSIGIGWNSQSVESNCNDKDAKKELVQIKGRKIEMCHYSGSTQQPETYSYNSSESGIKYTIVANNYPGDQNRKTILSVLATLEI
jgi:hypothetical protein